jgi:GntR family transcriptional regulator
LNTSFPRKLQSRFEQALIEGECPRGEMRTIDDLARQFQVPVEQMRQVMLAAHRKGLVEGAGGEKEAFRILGLAESAFSSVFTHTAKAGLKPSSRVRRVEIEPATAEVAEKLSVAVGSPVYRYVRTRYADDRVLANQTNYMPFEICPGLEDDDVSRYSFQKLLEGKYHTVLCDMKEKYDLVPAIDEDREILGLPKDSSVLLIERIALSATGWPVVWANIRIRPDRYQYVAALWPQAAAVLSQCEEQ